jgi:TonB-dependent SusC/RagA subfamily outer membrane receptor
MQPAAHAGGSVQSATAEDLKDVRSGRAEELFVGRFSGVRVLRTVGGGLQVSIRGGGLWSADQQPLYVIDDVAVTVSPERGLDWLVPEDIARIEILKNAAETTMFGARGANGVVLITTRRPR